ncbi:tRNA-splicing endonuclease subunit Sen34 [Orbilia ellipsospora]|uniref:tRNA-splicing endonuclease subunit Sen34 n=1 Tax=Orbilia ellipsospora TaxID=2528407 RepID=A0AAV9XCR9_9PEZI
MCGSLFGTLPQAQQQNVFHGLPLELMEEEVKLLIDNRAAIIIDDSAAHDNAIQVLSMSDKANILALKTQERDELALSNQKEAKRRKELAIEHAKTSGKWKKKVPKETSGEGSSVAEAESLFSGSIDVPQETDGTTVSTSRQNSSADDIGNRQFIIPMTSSSIGRHVLRLPHESAHTPNPSVARYNVYKYLQNLGYFLSPGLRFGCQFLAYPGDPLRFHSHFLVKALQWDEELSILDLVGGGRLGTGVKKAWMIAGLENKHSSPELKRQEDEDETKAGNVRVFCVEWGGFG